MCYEFHYDELIDAVPLELQMQIGFGKATGTPMLEGRLRLQLAPDLAGTITSAVICLSYITTATVYLQRSYVGGILCLSVAQPISERVGPRT